MATNTPNYDIDYSAKEFRDVKVEEMKAAKDNAKFYNQAVKDINDAIDTQKDGIKAWGETQADIQQKRTDFAIEQIEQKKEQAQKDYIKEQSASYVDWQKQSNAYGANAEQMAAQGMTNTGYSESSQVSMYNEYQRRVTAARETIERAKIEFDNQITQAKLQNDSLLAEIAYNTLKEINTLTLAGVEKTTLLRSEQKKRDLEIKQMYHDRWQDVLDQINKENALKEEVRQYNKNMQFQIRRANKEEIYRNQQLQLERDKFNWQKEQATNSGDGGGSGRISSSKGESSSSGSSSGIEKSSTSNNGLNFSTYEEAVAYMERNGVPSSVASGVMTKSEYRGRGRNYDYANYAAYLKDYARYAVLEHGKTYKRG